MAKLSRLPSVAARSPWSWPIVPLVAVALVGQWRGMTAAGAVAAAFVAVGIGVAIGLTVAGRQASVLQAPAAQLDEDPPKTRSLGTPSVEASAEKHVRAPGANSSQRTVDLRGARLTNTMLVRADLRHADLRGATLMGADLSGADLTGARLGPLDDDLQINESA